LSLNAPNLYYFVSNDYYRIGLAVGIPLTVVASLLFAWRARHTPPTTHEFLLVCAACSVAMAPFLLPKMHDRYFLAADLVSIALALHVPRLWYVPVGFQISSGLAYIPVVSDTITHYGGEVVRFMPLAVFLNVVLMAVLSVEFVRRTRGRPDGTRGAEPRASVAIRDPAV